MAEHRVVRTNPGDIRIFTNKCGTVSGNWPTFEASVLEDAEQTQVPLGRVISVLPARQQHNVWKQNLDLLSATKRYFPVRSFQDIRARVNLTGIHWTPKIDLTSFPEHITYDAAYGHVPLAAQAFEDQSAFLLMSALPKPAREAVLAFSNGIRPSASTVKVAVDLAETVVGKAAVYEVTHDETDGSLSFEAKTSEGHLITGELGLDGEFGIDVYQDEPASAEAVTSSIDVDDIWLEHLPKASVRDFSQRL